MYDALTAATGVARVQVDRSEYSDPRLRKAMRLALGHRSGVPWNEPHFNDVEFDTLLTKAEGTLDIEERQEILGQMQMIMQERGPMTQPLWRSTFAFYDQSVVGFRLHPTSYVFGEELGIQA